MDVTITLDQNTAVVLKMVAESYKMNIVHLVEQQLYRDAASMSGWPGELGTRIRRELRNLHYPPDDVDIDEIPW